MCHWSILCYWVILEIYVPPSRVSLQIKKNSIAKAKKEEKMSKEFAAMEEAAMKAYEKDMKRLLSETGKWLDIIYPWVKFDFMNITVNFLLVFRVFSIWTNYTL